jgi:hypothetical protein
MKSICIELHDQAVKTEATGLYSRKAIERLGFTVAAEFLYADYEVPYLQIHGNPPKLSSVLFPRKVTLKLKIQKQFSAYKCNFDEKTN